MVSNRIWAVINVSLSLTALLLILNFFEVGLPIYGNAAYYFDSNQPTCVASFKETKSKLADLDLCCQEAQRQLQCVKLEQTLFVGNEELILNKKCFTGENTIQYYLNNKAYNYCKMQKLI